MILGSKVGSKQVPNRIINAEGVRKALDTHLGRYHSALGSILSALGRLLSARRSPKEGPRNSNPPTAARRQATERGGERRQTLSQELGMEGLDNFALTPTLYTP